MGLDGSDKKTEPRRHHYGYLFSEMGTLLRKIVSERDEAERRYLSLVERVIKTIRIHHPASNHKCEFCQQVDHAGSPYCVIMELEKEIRI